MARDAQLDITAVLLARIAAFCTETGMAERKLSKLATGDARAIGRIRLYASSQKTIRDVESFMDRYRQACEAGAESDRETQEAA